MRYDPVLLTSAACLWAVCLSVAFPVTSRAESNPAEISLEYRPRIEADKRFGPETGLFVTHRARIGIGLRREEWRVLIEPQDVRAWGSEANPTAFEPNLGLHQGFVEWNADEAFKLRAGRQSINYLNQRLIGGLNWAQQGRSFDALQLFGNAGKINWSAWGAPLTDEPPRRSRDGAVGAGLLQWKNAGRTAALLGVGDMNRKTSVYRWTVGPHSSGKLFGPFVYQVEAYYQFGHQNGEDIRAYLANAELGWVAAKLPLKPALRIGYDVLSGTTGDTTTFDTLYGTNHAFYGFMDAFLAIPANTGGRGLQDLYVKASANMASVNTTLAIHHLAAGPENTGTFGTEADLVFQVPVATGVVWESGAAVLVAGDAFAAVRPEAPNYPAWGYSMLTVAMR